MRPKERLLNALFLAVARCGGRPKVRGDRALEISLTVHQTTVVLTLDRPKLGRRGSDGDDSREESTLRVPVANSI
jgi:hypothetical protein